MTTYADSLLVALLALDLYMVSTNRLGSCIRASALQGVLLSALPVLVSGIGPSSSFWDAMHLAAIVIGTLCVKGLLIPWVLFRAMRSRGETREFEPFVSLHLSQVINGVLCGGAFWIATGLSLPAANGHAMGLAVGLATLFIGLYMIINRHNSISQVLGFLVVESGVMVIAWALLRKPSFVIEVGALLDVLVAVMVLGVLATSLEATGSEGGVRKGDTSQ